MTDDARSAARDDARHREPDRGHRIAEPGVDTAIPEDLQDTWNTPTKVWEREQSPVDVLGDISDEDLYRDQQGSGERRSGI